MKRITSIILCLLMIITTFSQSLLVTYAVGEPTITCESKECCPGDTVTINVVISNNPGIIAINITPNYSAELGTPTAANGNLFAAMNTGSKNYMFANMDGNNITSNGTLFSYTFTIGEDVASGDYSVSVSVGDASNMDEEKVTFTVIPGTICVKTASVPVTGIALDKTTATVAEGNTVTLTPVFTPETATNKNVTWTTSDASVATVENGVVTGVKKGTATITVKTEDGNYTASCVVTVECAHTHTTTHEAVASTCQTHGHATYVTCDDCGTIISGSDAELPFGNHTYIEKVDADYLVSAATCASKAVYYKSCSVCGLASTETFMSGEKDANNHVGGTYTVGQKEATCYEEGYTGDTHCSGCDALLSKGDTIQKDEHNPASTWSTDETYHWHDCQTVGCGNMIDKAVHSGGTATCTSQAICEVCGVKYGTVNAANHTGGTEIRNAIPASCNTDGYTGDTYCLGCNEKIAEGTVIPATGNHVDTDGAWETDGTKHWHTCACGTKFDETTHAGGTATCKDHAVCSVCGASYGALDSANHVGGTEVRNAATASCNTDGYTGDTYCLGCNEKIAEGTVIPATGDHVDADGAWETDGTKHWHTCACGTIFDETTHSGGTATCKDHAVCSVCGASYGELDSANHVGETYVIGQKEATCYEEGYTGDTYCSDCNQKIASGSVIPMGEHNPASTWSTDETYHWHVCETIGCGNLIDKAAHSGGTATCTSQAICEVCGVKYGTVNAANHTGGTEVRNAVPASCDTDGYTGDTYCLGCGEMITQGTVIPATGDHVDTDGAWETDGTKHWHTCACGAIFDETTHSGGTATCKNEAVCAVCGTSYGEKDTSNHTDGTEVRNAVPASCNTDGYTGDTYCLDCGEMITQGTVIPATGDHVDADGAWETDGTKHWHTCACGAIFDETTHSGGTATCKDHAVCSVCGTVYGELDSTNHTGSTYLVGQKEATCYEEGYTGDTYCSDCNEKISSGSVIPKGEHSPASTWSTDETYHWHECRIVGCGNIIDKAAHSGGTATCMNKAVCEICGVAYGTVDSDNHAGKTEIRNAVEATCTTEGYTGDVYCVDCGEKLESGHSIEKTGHTITDWTVTKEATTSECGEKTGHCSVCHEEFKVETAKLTAAPVSEEQTEYKGMETAPKLVPSGDTVLPENVVFVAEQSDGGNLSEEQQEAVNQVVEELESNAASLLGDGVEAEKVDVLCVFQFDLLLRNTSATGEALGDEEYHFDGSVDVTVEMPEAMKTAKNPCLIHLKDDGTCERIDYTINDDGTITLSVTGFSSFVLLDVEATDNSVSEEPETEEYTDDSTTETQKTETTENTVTEETIKEAPKTGDFPPMILWIMISVLSVAGIVFGVKKKLG